MAATELILLVAGIIAIGVLSQLLANRLRVPSIIFYIAAGVVLGPEVLNLVRPTTLGDALPALVGLAVAIIVFEGAFHLKVDRIREAPGAAGRLVTVGAAIAFVGTAVAVRFGLGTTWPLAGLVGALLVATGPTVITPILSVVPVRDRVAATLEVEGIVNDVTAAILAVVIFKLVNPGSRSGDLLTDFTTRLGTGILVGLVVAAVVYYVLRYIDLSPVAAPQSARLLVLAGALVAYAVANAQQAEAGVAAAATAGVVLGNADVPYESEIEGFKGDITLLVLPIVFIMLTALLRFDILLELWVGKLVVIAAVALVVRPLLMYVSTIGGRFTRNERVFMGLLGPRGIIPASVATLFAVELRTHAESVRTEALALDAGAERAAMLAEVTQLNQQADVLVGTVFVVILATVVFQGGFARQMAAYLNVIPMRVIIVGAGRVGRSLADRLVDRGENVVIVEDDDEAAAAARSDGYTVVIGDGTDTDVLREAGIENARIVVAATGDDTSNLLIAQLVSSRFAVPKIFARANDPDNVDAFEELGVTTISSSMAAAWAIDNQIERPALANWMNDVDRVGDVQEVELQNESLAGSTIDEIGPKLPDGCLIVLHGRDGEVSVPDSDQRVELGDHITLVGTHDGVREGMALLRA